jgi:hypothetical protein
MGSGFNEVPGSVSGLARSGSRRVTMAQKKRKELIKSAGCIFGG